ncbi:MAG: hypothetical protein ONB23_11515 [candidate division KSB1 bacterium]|nr:hypothetical protein [candidate division KSB1 bacterium]
MREAAIALVVAAMALTPPWVRAQSQISGYVFGDYYFIVQNHRKELDGQNGFWIRRVYLTYDRKLAGTVSSRLRFEMNHPGNFSSGAATPYVKDAYLNWKFGSHQLLLGISPSPAFAKIEDIWGYRAVEKTPLDLHKIADSRDFGVALSGSLTGDQKVVYHAMVGNGTGVGAENDKGKNLMLALGLRPTPRLFAELYGARNTYSEDHSTRTLQAFVSYQTENFRLGLQWADYREKPRLANERIRIASGFGVVRLGENLFALARVDRLLDPNRNGDRISYLPFDPLAKSTLLILGLDWGRSSTVRFLPNVEIIRYDKRPSGVRPRMDVVGRLTLYFSL